MLSGSQRTQYIKTVIQSSLSSFEKRSLISKITSRSATPQSVRNLLIGAGITGAVGGITGFNSLFNGYFRDREVQRDGDKFSDLDPSVDASQNPEGSHNQNPIGNRNPVEGDSRDSDTPYRPIGSDGSVTWIDPDQSHGSVLDKNGNARKISPGRPGDRNHLVDTDGDGVGDTNSGVLDNDGGLFGGLGLGGLIDALANRFLDFELTGGEREANAFTAEQNRLANEFSAQQAEISRDWQEQMYEKYNSLSGKLAQAEEAGINPMFALGSGVTPTGFSSPSPSGSGGSSVGASPAMGGNLPALIQSFLGIAKVKSDIAKTKAETTQIAVNTDIQLQKLPAEIAKLESSTGLDSSASQLNLQKIVESATSIDKIKSDMSLNDYHAKMFASQVSYLEAQADYINSIKDSEKKIKASQALMIEWQEKNKELFKGLEVGSDVISTLSNIGLGIFNAKTGRILSNKPSSGGLVINNSIPLPLE